MAGLGSLLSKIVPPKKKTSPDGVTVTNTFNPGATNQIIAAPQGRDHLTDIFSDRATNDAKTLMKSMFRSDPDVSATVHAYLTVANTDPWFIVRDLNGVIDRPGHQLLSQVLLSLFTRVDYTLPQPFAIKQSLKALCADMRFLLLMRGAIGAELVVDKTLLPSSIRQVDMATIQWFEPKPGVYTPQQQPTSSNTLIDLNIPSFFVSFYRKDPTNIYAESPFVSAINTIAARQQVINDLYRLMTVTGYPRLEITVVEEVLLKSLPANLAQDEDGKRAWLNARLQEIGNAVSNLRVDQTISHFDSTEIDILNQGGPSKSMDVSAIIEVLNAQNQAALKTMATVIGRGEMGVNTASVEARVFSLSAEELNVPVADMLSQIFTFALRLNGSQSVVEVGFDHVELRPFTELEPQMTVRQDRLLKLLSYGLITDDDFHMEMFNAIRPDAVPELSGTRFYMGTADPADSISPNSDPLGRSVSAPGSKASKSNSVGGPGASKGKGTSK